MFPFLYHWFPNVELEISVSTTPTLIVMTGFAGKAIRLTSTESLDLHPLAPVAITV